MGSEAPRRSGTVDQNEASARSVPHPDGKGLNLRERKKVKLRNQIYDRAIKLFRQYGYDSTCVNDIIRDLDIGQTTFFRYFPTKDALLQEYVKRWFLHINELERIHLATEANTFQHLVHLHDELAAEMEADRNLWRSIASTGMINPWRSPEDAETWPSRRPLEATIAKGQKLGDVGCTFPVAVLAQFLAGLATVIILEWIVAAPHEPYPLGERLRSAVSFFLASAKP